jgi:hypothetical protein
MTSERWLVHNFPMVLPLKRRWQVQNVNTQATYSQEYERSRNPRQTDVEKRNIPDVLGFWLDSAKGKVLIGIQVWTSKWRKGPRYLVARP